MTKRKGEISAAAIDRGWPHQAVLLDDLCVKENFVLLREWLAVHAPDHQTRKVEARYPDGYHVEIMRVHCFRTAEEAEAFRAHFGAEHFDPAWRGRSAEGMRWQRAEPWVRVLECGPLRVPDSLRS